MTIHIWEKNIAYKDIQIYYVSKWFEKCMSYLDKRVLSHPIIFCYLNTSSNLSVMKGEIYFGITLASKLQKRQKMH